MCEQEEPSTSAGIRGGDDEDGSSDKNPDEIDGEDETDDLSEPTESAAPEQGEKFQLSSRNPINHSNHLLQVHRPLHSSRRSFRVYWFR